MELLIFKTQSGTTVYVSTGGCITFEHKNWTMNRFASIDAVADFFAAEKDGRRAVIDDGKLRMEVASGFLSFRLPDFTFADRITLTQHRSLDDEEAIF